MALSTRDQSSPVNGIGPDYFVPKVPWSRTWSRRILIVLAAVTVLASLGWGIPMLHNRCGDLRSGLTRVDGECIGVAVDVNHYHFSEDLRSIQDAIAAENDRVHEAWTADPDKAYVRVALVSPLTAGSTSFMTQDQIRHALQGAHVAQHRANTSQDLDDPTPMVQLVLANTGSRQTEWRRIVPKLEDLTEDDHPLVAVIGLGTSTVDTLALAHRLSESGTELPMVGGVITADEFRNIDGFVRVSPSDTHYVKALARYLTTRPDLRTGIMVYDTSEPDLYVRDLRLAYEAQLKRYLTIPAKGYSGSADPSKTRPQLFTTIRDSVCNDPRPDMILFAGRALDLDDFVESLKGRSCRDEPISILIGATGLASFERLSGSLTEGNISIINAAAIDPRWSSGSNDSKIAAPEHFPAFAKAFNERLDEPNALIDGYAMVYHDAIATAVKAIRIVAREVPEADQLPSAADVRRQLLNLNRGSEVRGAGGTLSFSLGQSDPIGKPVPIIVIPSLAPPGPPTDPPYVIRPES